MYNCMYVCIFECVCWPEPPDHSVWVTDCRLIASIEYSPVRKEEVVWSSDEFLPHNGASMQGSRTEWNWSQTVPYSLSVIAWEDYERLKWPQMVRGAHSTLDSSYIQQRPGGVSRFLGRLCFRFLQPQWLAHSHPHVFISYGIKVRICGKWSQYVLILKRLLKHQKWMLPGWC